MITALVIWGCVATLVATLMAGRANSWMGRWHELSAEHARALDQVAYLKEALAVYRHPLMVHTQDHGAAVHRPGVRVPDVREVPPGGVVQAGWTEQGRRAAALQPVSGLSPPGGFCAPGEASPGGGDEAPPWPRDPALDAAVGTVRDLRPPPGPDEIPY